MSRVGRKPIPLPSGVKFHMRDRVVTVEGPKGTLNMSLPAGVNVEQSGGALIASPAASGPRSRALHGLGRALLNNMVQGVSVGFSKQLQIEGVGFKAEVIGKTLSMYLGYTHSVVFTLPDGISASVEKQTLVTLTGPDKQMVGEIAARIRSSRPPEPYKGKGIRYIDEFVRRKVGKAVATTTGGGGK